METTSGLFETGNHEMNDHIKPAGVGAIVVAVLFIAGCKPLSQEREFSTTREPVTTRNVEAKEPETRPTLYEELQEPKAEPGSSQPTEVDRPRIRKEISDFKATTRPTGSIGAAILKVNRDNLSSQDILTRIRSELESTAMTFNEEVYYRRAEEMIMMATRDLISETLLYQEIAARIPEDQDPAIVKAVDKIQMMIKALCYERQQRGELSEFWAHPKNFDDRGIPLAREVFDAICARAGRTSPRGEAAG